MELRKMLIKNGQSKTDKKQSHQINKAIVDLIKFIMYSIDSNATHIFISIINKLF